MAKGKNIQLKIKIAHHLTIDQGTLSTTGSLGIDSESYGSKQGQQFR